MKDCAFRKAPRTSKNLPEILVPPHKERDVLRLPLFVGPRSFCTSALPPSLNAPRCHLSLELKCLSFQTSHDHLAIYSLPSAEIICPCSRVGKLIIPNQPLDLILAHALSQD